MCIRRFNKKRVYVKFVIIIIIMLTMSWFVVSLMWLIGEGGGNESYDKAVHVEVYYETLCPDSIAFIKHQLWPVFQTLYPSRIVDIDLFAYGNTQEKELEKGIYAFTCQHGELECTLDAVETCVGHFYEKKRRTDVIRFIYCVAHDSSMIGAKKCSLIYKMDWKKIQQCVKSSLGNKLQHEVGLRTPPHTFIPWIVIDDDSSHQEHFRSNFKEAVCARYKGTKSSSCNGKDKNKSFLSHLFREFWNWEH